MTGLNGNRKFLSKLLSVPYVILFFMSTYDIPGSIQPILDYIALFMLWFAAIGRLYTTFFINKSEELSTTNIYSLVRNPLYVFSLIGVIGLTLISRKIFIILVIPILYICIYNSLINREELFLQTRFGDQFLRYKSMIPRWIPSFKHYNFNHEVTCNNVARINSALRDSIWWLVGYVAIKILVNMNI